MFLVKNIRYGKKTKAGIHQNIPTEKIKASDERGAYVRMRLKVEHFSFVVHSISHQVK